MKGTPNALLFLFTQISPSHGCPKGSCDQEEQIEMRENQLLITTQTVEGVVNTDVTRHRVLRRTNDVDVAELVHQALEA